MDPLVHYGRHFGRTKHAMCSVLTLLKNGISRIGENADTDTDGQLQRYTDQYIRLLLPPCIVHL
jgi:hypothetical protein